MKKMDKYLKDLYYNPSLPSSFGGVDRLMKQVRTEGNVSLKRHDLTEWLKGQDTYTLHKPILKNIQRNKTIVAGIDDQWQADLADLSSLQKYNNGYKYLLTCIDIFSKFAWIVPLKNKSGKSICEAFKEIFQEGRIPHKLQTDDGTEFKNKEFQTLLKEYDVHFFTTKNETKAAVVERFNRTIKTRMWRYFTHNNTHCYVNVLEKLLSSYNKSFHRSIGISPLSVNKSNESKVWQKLYGHHVASDSFTFTEGDKVRISKAKRTFEKGYLPNWTEEIFTIHKCIPRQPPVYKIHDYHGSIIDGTFYAEELQKVYKDDEVYKVEDVIKTRKRKGKNEYLVKWVGYPSEFNSWVSDLQPI